jgi:beta-lactamase regulating signal transducer with metallopeptidase domain/HEAT repeat protein
MRLIGWAIVHSLWQGGAIALIAAALLSAARRAGASVRYAIAIVSLMAMVILPVATALSGVSGFRIPASTIAQSGQPSGIIAVDEKEPLVSRPAATSQTEIARPASIMMSEAAVRSIDTALPWLVGAWLIGLLVSSVRLMGGLARTRRITRRGASPANDALSVRIEKICDRLGVRRAVRAVQSIEIDVPLVIGAIRPVIVVPASLMTGLTPLQLDMLLAHELAHVRRHDYLVNLVQTVIETLLFYHPAARWLSDRAREERENCCDDIAVNAFGGDAQQYTSTLLVLEEARGQGFGLTAAANGGSLLKRAQRLLTGKTASLELGPRWIAGVITIGAALFASRDAMAAVQSSFVRYSVVMGNDSTSKKHARQDTSHGAPSSVVRAPANLSLEDKWKWAERNVAGSAFWIGYLIGGDETGSHNVYVSDIPVALNGATNLTGRLNFGDDLSGLRFSGVPLAPLVGNHSRHSTAIFFEVRTGLTGTRIERAHINTFFLPGYFNGEPLAWLDSAADSESLAMLESLMSRSADKDVRVDIVSAMGSHRSPAVLGLLTRILESRDVDDVRTPATDYLGRINDPRAMSALARAARNDRSRNVRGEAIESIGQMEATSATDTLISFASTFESSQLIDDVVEAIGHRPDDRAFNYLVQTVNTGRSMETRRRAAEAIGDMPGQRGASTVINFAQTHPDAEIRREFIEALARLEPSSKALDILQRIALKDPDDDVRAEAIETIGDVHDGTAEKILIDFARNSLNDRVRGKALETIASMDDHETALTVLVDAANKDQSEDVRREAIEALGDANDSRAMAALASLVKNGETDDIRINALEVYADAAKTKDAMTMLRERAQSDRSADVRDKARELLKELAKN